VRTSVIVFLLSSGVVLAATQHDHAARQHDHAALDARGTAAMGFDQQRTTHHFKLFADGGAVEVAAKDAEDTASREAIRSHLQEIAAAFTAGDFAKPGFIHDRMPPGVPALKRLASAVTYTYQPLPSGGRVRISSATQEGVEAVHAFLRFQIDEHRTGDATTIEQP
jgi:hypothetical protein